MQRLLLPQDASRPDRDLRARTLWTQRDQYPWAHVPGQPPFCKVPPPQELWTERKTTVWDLDLDTSVADFALATVARFGKPDDTVASFRRYYPLRRIPGTARRWKTDAEFARQRLDGVNPFLLERMTAFHEKFPVNQGDRRRRIESLLPDGTTLDQLLDQGRLYWLDYALLDGIPLVYGRFMAVPCALFWVDDTRRLMPLGIQLGQDPSHVLFTPRDPHWTWLTARTHVQCADAAYHEIAAHLLRTHLVGECFWVAANRALPAQHPVYELLRPHFTSTIEINHKARTQLIAPGGPIDRAIAVGSEGGLDLVARAWREYRFDRYELEADLERRGVLDAEALPHFHFRDDALAWHRIIDRYVRELMAVFYREDDALVRGDEELQAWVRELESDQGGQLRGLPTRRGKLPGFDALCRLLTQLLFTVSVEHSAVNNGQYDQFGWIPNAPGAMYLPPPTDRSARCEANFVYALPSGLAVAEQLTLVHLLSVRTEHPMGSYPDDFFVFEPRARAAVDRFRGGIADLDRAIRERNRHIAVPYTYLLPAVTGRSIGT